MSKTLERLYVSFNFELAGLTPDSDEDAIEASRPVYERAYALVDKSHRSIADFVKKELCSDVVLEIDAFEMCEQGGCEVVDDKLVWGIEVVANNQVPTAILRGMRDHCLSAFAQAASEAAQAAGTPAMSAVLSSVKTLTYWQESERGDLTDSLAAAEGAAS